MAANSLLVLNAGSSSLKFKLFSVTPFVARASGLVERIGDTANSTLVAKAASGGGVEGGDPQERKWKEQTPIPDHVAAMERIMEFLGQRVSSRIGTDVTAVGHRLVHGLDIHRYGWALNDPQC